VLEEEATCVVELDAQREGIGTRAVGCKQNLETSMFFVPEYPQDSRVSVSIFGVQMGNSLEFPRRENTASAQSIFTQPPRPLVIVHPPLWGASADLARCHRVRVAFSSNYLYICREKELLAENDDIKPHRSLAPFWGAQH
jgi:hypothetical protein